MATISKIKPTPTPKPSATQKPWDKLGITYQQWYYRNKAGTLPGQNAPTKTSAPAANHNAIRDSILVTEFLARFEAQQDNANFTGMDISVGMASALYNTLRTDGH